MILETILGGLTGLIGNAVTSVFNFKTQKLKNEFEIKKIEANSKAMVLDAKARIAITRANVEGAEEVANANAYVEGQKGANKPLFGNTWVDNLLRVEGNWKWIAVPIASIVAVAFGFVDFVRGLMRPVLTIYLTGITTFITYKAWEIMQLYGKGIDATQAVDIFKDTTSIVTYLTVSCVTWWFADRRMAKTIMQMKGADVTKIDDDIKID